MISIIIPTLNEEKIIETALKQFEKLTLDHEIIVSDGKSTDKTVTIAKEDGAKVIEYTGQKRQTIAGGRNAGAKAAQGEFLVFFDADCTIMNPDTFFTKALAYFKNSKIVGLTSRIEVLPEFRTWDDLLVMNFINSWYWFVNNILRIGMNGGEFQMVRKSAFEKVAGFREGLVAAEDVDFLSRLSRIGRVPLYFSLTVYHTGRRAHVVGWPKLLFSWTINTISLMLFKKSASSVWTEVR